MKVLILLTDLNLLLHQIDITNTVGGMYFISVCAQLYILKCKKITFFLESMCILKSFSRKRNDSF